MISSIEYQKVLIIQTFRNYFEKAKGGLGQNLSNTQLCVKLVNLHELMLPFYYSSGPKPSFDDQ